MIAVGIKELKARLSSYVEKVQQGEEVVITDHGREVALVVPISPERRAVKTLMAEGRAKWSGGKPAGKRGVTLKGESLSDTVLEERR
ncbi:type II toxin-antitoxin system Phd/YefM family antitoxin [Geobacter grbiciae]|uniref:type II toxin-antitoxin system Phd/YefM family antitoxin n=1 Tax=Geobacter grbiciae TaxID=155042 RepID=UPI001C0197F2|nr:type II toxin-antitoxin system prevent-host-death family antitoxin [Geobacter grbiciae]MBT1074873.1 type II toxin-antitoxin system prevent-host-death family antitoxin [Geobacter grbiciae]